MYFLLYDYKTKVKNKWAIITIINKNKPEMFFRTYFFAENGDRDVFLVNMFYFVIRSSKRLVIKLNVEDDEKNITDSTTSCHICNQEFKHLKSW